MFKEPDDPSPGWEAIDQCMAAVYGDQEPLHYGTTIPACLGGSDPIDGISVYRADSPVPHWHFVTYGFTELHAKEGDDLEVSGFGFELSFRLTPPSEQTPPNWVFSCLQNLGRYVFQTGNALEAGHYMNLNGPIAPEAQKAMRATAVGEDPQLGTISTSHGSVTFLQIVGITLDELLTIKRWDTARFLNLLSDSVPSLVTDLGRHSVLDDDSVKSRVDELAREDGSTTSVLNLGAVAWKTRRSSLKPKRLEIVLGANGIHDFKAVLPGRLCFDRDLIVMSADRMIVFEPGQTLRWSEESQNDLKLLHVALPPNLALELSDSIQPKEGIYAVPNHDNIVFRVEKSYIKAQDGSVQKVIG